MVMACSEHRSAVVGTRSQQGVVKGGLSGSVCVRLCQGQGANVGAHAYSLDDGLTWTVLFYNCISVNKCQWPHGVMYHFVQVHVCVAEVA